MTQRPSYHLLINFTQVRNRPPQAPWDSVKEIDSKPLIFDQTLTQEKTFSKVVSVKRISRDNTPEVPASLANLCSKQQPPNSLNLMSLYEPSAGQSDDSAAISSLRVGRVQNKPSLFVSSLSNLGNYAIDFSSKSMFGFNKRETLKSRDKLS